MLAWTIGCLACVGCILLHAIGIGILDKLQSESPYFSLGFDPKKRCKHVIGQMTQITTVCLSIAFLHIIEAMLWAVLFVSIDAIQNYSDALFYSFDAMSTRGGTGNINLAEEWRVLGAVEACLGMLLVGISTAFLFGVFQREGHGTDH